MTIEVLKDKEISGESASQGEVSLKMKEPERVRKGAKIDPTGGIKRMSEVEKEAGTEAETTEETDQIATTPPGTTV